MFSPRPSPAWTPGFRRLAGYFGLFGTAVLLSGCAPTPVHRDRQYSTVSSQWDDATHARVLDQRIQLGDTRTMVYVALGMPLVAPTLTDDQPPRERWEYLVFETDPSFPLAPAKGQPPPSLVSSPAQPAIRAVTTNNVVFPPIGGPDARMLAVEFGPDDRVVAWTLYPDSHDGAIDPNFMEISLPPSPRVSSTSH
jgi:outer membrane protein assembly factor BamE (lipoprotein component of BamABCDE complex)